MDVFLKDEKQEVVSLYKTLRREYSEPFEGKRYFRMKSAIMHASADGRLRRDIFGFNPLVNALQTAILVCEEIGQNKDAVQSCLLAPFFSTTESLDKLGKVFGKGVRNILHGLVNIRDLYAKNPSVQSENFRNLIVSFAEDMRVILIMIANRTNLMRKIKDNANIEAQMKISSEATYLYAPLAHKLGLYKIKSELEDLSLKYMNHDAYYHIKDKLNATKNARDAYMEQFMKPIREMLDAAHLKYHMKGRTKSIHSIWQKMQRQGCPFEGVYDLFAIRIILDAPLKEEKQQCWQVYSLITDKYRPNPKRLRDWLSIPKSNGYESLHITVLGPENKWVEVQIRTSRMD
jgi:GTP pyrophosphokinase